MLELLKMYIRDSNYTDSAKLISEFVNEGIVVQSATFHNQDLEEYFLSLMEGGESHV